MARAAQPTAQEYLPAHPTLEQLGPAAQLCRGCDLYKYATQAVVGEGPASARVMMVGEEPGDREDLAGKPFVGPAGKLLDRALADAKLAREDVYVTNAVKHFKFEERGKRRLHKKPSTAEVVACRPWLEAEIEIVKPRIIVCLGATAALSVIGKEHKLLRSRGQFFANPRAEAVTATVHPSAILRAPDDFRRHREYEAFVRDLAGVRRKLGELEKLARRAG
jgi:uracil-DNA glycosylase